MCLLHLFLAVNLPPSNFWQEVQRRCNDEGEKTILAKANLDFFLFFFPKAAWIWQVELLFLCPQSSLYSYQCQLKGTWTMYPQMSVVPFREWKLSYSCHLTRELDLAYCYDYILIKSFASWWSWRSGLFYILKRIFGALCIVCIYKLFGMWTTMSLYSFKIMPVFTFLYGSPNILLNRRA